MPNNKLIRIRFRSLLHKVSWLWWDWKTAFLEKINKRDIIARTPKKSQKLYGKLKQTESYYHKQKKGEQAKHHQPWSSPTHTKKKKLIITMIIPLTYFHPLKTNQHFSLWTEKGMLLKATLLPSLQIVWIIYIGEPASKWKSLLLIF